MAIYYYKLWDIMKKRNITAKELSEQLNMSTSTITKLRKNQSVSLETLDQIREYLECDFGDLITSVPASIGDTVNWTRGETPFKVNHVYRMALIDYMEHNHLTAQDVANTTTLALNTVKDFLRGKDLSLRSILKLSELGIEYNTKVNKMLEQDCVRNQVYCNQRCGKRKECMALRFEFITPTNEYVPYCYLGFSVTENSEGEIVAEVSCPRPKNTRELVAATEKYGSYPRGEVICIPAKKKGQGENEDGK